MYYKLRQACVTNLGSFVLLQIRANVVTNWGSYFKLGQPLLQNRTAITNWGKMYYKLGQVLQIRAIITNWGITASTLDVQNLVGRNFCMKINYVRFVSSHQNYLPLWYIFKTICDWSEDILVFDHKKKLYAHTFLQRSFSVL